MTANRKFDKNFDPEEQAEVANGAGPAAPAPDPFDVEALQLDQAFAEATGVKKLLATVPVRKPNPQDWVRVHPGSEYRGTFALIEIKDDREYFLLTPAIARELSQELFRATIYTVINRQGVVSLWPVKLPAPGGRANEWHVSAHGAAEMAMKNWVRVRANMSLRAYEIETTTNPIPEPGLPDLPFKELLRIGFKNGRLVDSLEHPVVKQLRGF